jgi:hypothetical protein
MRFVAFITEVFALFAQPFLAEDDEACPSGR